MLLLSEHEAPLCLQTFGQTCCAGWWILLLGHALSELHDVEENAMFPRGNTGKSWGTCSSPFPIFWHVQCSGSHHTRVSPGTGPSLLASMCIYSPFSSSITLQSLETWCSRNIVKIMCHCGISDTQSYEIWKQVLQWATGLSKPVVLSGINSWSCGWTLWGTFLSLEDFLLPHCCFLQKSQKFNSSAMWAFRWDSAPDMQNWVHTHSI